MFLAQQSRRWIVYLSILVIAFVAWRWLTPLATAISVNSNAVPIKIAVSQTPLSSLFILLINWAFLSSRGLMLSSWHAVVECNAVKRCFKGK